MQDELREKCKKIQSLMSKAIPEKWEAIYLYASVFQENIETEHRGEMFFYYIPKKIIKHKPINCYEIPGKFGIDDNTYNGVLKKLYQSIKELNHLAKRKWTNVTITIENNIFTIEYHYNNIAHSAYTDEQRHIVWCYKYLKTPLDALSQKDRTLVEHYEEESSLKPTIYKEGIYKIDEPQEIRNQILKC